MVLPGALGPGHNGAFAPAAVHIAHEGGGGGGASWRTCSFCTYIAQTSQLLLAAAAVVVVVLQLMKMTPSLVRAFLLLAMCE